MIFNYLVITLIVIYLLYGLFLATTRISGDSTLGRIIYAWLFIFLWPILPLARYLHILK